MNGFYAVFLKTMGPGERYKDVSAEALERYRNLFPKDLVDFWATEGWASYADGLLWTVDPEEYAWIAEEWIKNCPEVPAAGLHVIARNAYGELYCLSLEGGCIVKISCPTGNIIAPRSLLKLKGDAVRAAQTFFGMASPERFDLFDVDGARIFPRALAKLGPVGENEIYGFVPIITLGGETCISNTEKFRMDVHLDILLASTEPRLLLM